MVEKETFRAMQTYACEECGHHYGSKREAKQCEVSCKEDGGCDPRIHIHSIEHEHH